MRKEEAVRAESARYPFGDDVEWVAVDRYGRVGIFTTGGVGPIPRAYLRAPELLQQLSEALWQLPERTEASLLTKVLRPDDFVAFARRGLFAFDWADVHRVTGRSGRYEIQARPLVPLSAATVVWPELIAALVEATRNGDLDFDQRLLDVAVLDCELGSLLLPPNDR